MQKTNNLYNNTIFFSAQQDYLYLLGIGNKSLPLWNLPKRFELAKQNVTQALQTNPDTTCYFMGAEHLPVLAKLWPQNRGAIVIEKSNLLYQYYLETNWIPEPANPIILVLGDWGFYSERADIEQKSCQLLSEITKLTLQLYAMPDSQWTNVSCYFLPSCNLDQKFYPNFKHSLALIINAKLFHQLNQKKYEAICQSEKNDKYLNLVITHGFENTSQDPVVRIDYLFKNLEPITFLIPGNNNKSPTQRLFVLGLVEDMNDALKFFELNKLFLERAMNLLKCIEHHLPKYIIWMNREPFDHLEDILFIEGMLHHLNIPCLQYFIDLYNQTTMEWTGSWSYFLTRDFFSCNHKFTLGAYSLLDQWYGPNPPLVKTYPLPFPKRDFYPVLTNAELTQDVVVIQTGPMSRTWNQLCHELFQILVVYLKPEIGSSISRFLHQLRLLFATQPFYSYHLQTNINAIDWSLNSLSRIFRSQQCLPTLAKYKTKYFGVNWDKAVPKEMYGGILPNQDAIRNTYQHSYISIIFSHLINTELAHHGAVYALQSGCLPLVYRPSFGLGPAPAYPFFKNDSLPYIDNPQDLEKMILKLKNNETLRQDMIAEMRNTWLCKVHDPNYFPSIQNLLDLPTPAYNQHEDLTFAQSPEMEDNLINIGMAYALYAAGFDKMALDIFMRVIQTQQIASEYIYHRAIQIACEINDLVTVNEIISLAKNIFPNQVVFHDIGNNLTPEKIGNVQFPPARYLSTYPELFEK